MEANIPLYSRNHKNKSGIVAYKSPRTTRGLCKRRHLFPAQQVDNAKQYHRANYGHDHAPKRKARNTLAADQIHDKSADKRAYDTYHNIFDGAHL